jgi:hypothetical protein
LPYSICGPKRAFFRLRTAKRPPTVALIGGGPALRVWLPSRRCPRLRTWEAFFSSQRSWASPYRAFLLPPGRGILSNPSFHSRAFLQNPFRPRSGAPAVCSREESRTHFTLSEGLVRSGAACSLGPSGLLGFLHGRPERGCLFLSPTISPLEEPDLTAKTPMDLMVFRPSHGGVSPRGAPAYLTFSTDRARHLLGR